MKRERVTQILSLVHRYTPICVAGNHSGISLIIKRDGFFFAKCSLFLMTNQSTLTAVLVKL